MGVNVDKIKGALYGVAIGDALGATLEFMSIDEIKKEYPQGLTEIVGGGWLALTPGEVTDDTQMTIAVAKGIVEDPVRPVSSIGKYFIEWYDSKPKDIGVTVGLSIRNAVKIASEFNYHSPSQPTEDMWMAAAEQANRELQGKSGGNGALMRTVYTGIYYGRDGVKYAADIAKMTHWDEESTVLCMNYSNAIARLIEGEALSMVIDSIGRFAELLNEERPPTGYVRDTMVNVLQAIHQTNSFEAAVVNAVNRGGDSDTVGAIAGGLVGAAYGYSDIPKRWIDVLDANVKAELDMLVEEACQYREQVKG
ncbi:MAG: ADP-ribosylglycohydrolase family protein [Bacillaceae bacterium]